MDLLTRLHFGGGGGGRIAPPAPPAPSLAAENVSKNKILERQRNARGFSSTLIGSLAGVSDQQQKTKTLLGS